MKKHAPKKSTTGHEEKSSSSLGRYMEQLVHKDATAEHKERGSKKWSERGWKHGEHCSCEKCAE